MFVILLLARLYFWHISPINLLIYHSCLSLSLPLFLRAPLGLNFTPLQMKSVPVGSNVELSVLWPVSPVALLFWVGTMLYLPNFGSWVFGGRRISNPRFSGLASQCRLPTLQVRPTKSCCLPSSLTPWAHLINLSCAQHCHEAEVLQHYISVEASGEGLGIPNSFSEVTATSTKPTELPGPEAGWNLCSPLTEIGGART